MESNTASPAYSIDTPIPMQAWGKDHWSTLAYIETVMEGCAGFQVGVDARMKTGRYHARVLASTPNPKRTTRPSAAIAMVMRPEHATVLKDGTRVEQHDDWHCLYDFQDAGLFNTTERFQPGDVLHFSPLGHALAAGLRAHKAQGGRFADYVPDPALLAPSLAPPAAPKP